MGIKYLVLVNYDIIDNRRRIKFVKLVESYLARVQKSSFEGILTKSQYDILLKRIDKFHDETDNIRVYKITGTSTVLKFPDKDEFEEDIIFF